jgi:hypothetical protein
MNKHLMAIVVCFLLVFTSGCSYFSAPTGTPSASSSAVSATPSSPQTTDTATATESPTSTIEATTEASAEPTDETTMEPTDSPTVAPTATSDATEGMIFPDSDTELIMWKDLITLTADKLDLAKNEIYARAGYKFTTAKFADYYSKLSWYKVDTAFSESKFSEIQYANIKLIQVAQKAIKGQLYQITSGTKLDFDQDGTLETLTYKVPDDTHVNVYIKDGKTTTVWKINCDTPSKKVYLGDINFKDGILDLFVDEFGPSDDYAVYVAGIKHHAYLNRTPTDLLPGTIKDLKLDGKGKITTERRMDILMTWFTKVSYKLGSSGKLAFVTQSSYSMGNFKCKTKVAIPLKKTKSSTSAIAFTVPTGTAVTLVSTDNKKWIKIKTAAGTGWLEMADLMTLANPNISGTDAFDGLVMAD